MSGIDILSADVEIARSRPSSDVRYGYGGIFLGFDFNV